MLETVKQLFANQYHAALCTLNLCIDRCPDDRWHERVANWKFSNLVFHTLFFTDVYLGLNEPAVRDQPFHRENADFFAEYEELADRAPVRVYDKPSLSKYLNFCRGKVDQVIAVQTSESLAAPNGFGRKNMSRAELHVYSIRHIQHHAAQLSLRLRLDVAADIPWVGSGWKEFK
jgi:hypothetical protein